jgi:hypothetical protein
LANKERHKTACRIWSKANPEEHRRRTKEWSKANPDKVFGHHIKQEYGITLEQYDERVMNQGGVCAICQEPEKKGRRLCVDHAHDGKFPATIRGLLCSSCNKALGGFKDSKNLLRQAEEYLSNAPDGPDKELSRAVAKLIHEGCKREAAQCVADFCKLSVRLKDDNGQIQSDTNSYLHSLRK